MRSAKVLPVFLYNSNTTHLLYASITGVLKVKYHARDTKPHITRQNKCRSLQIIKITPTTCNRISFATNQVYSLNHWMSISDLCTFTLSPLQTGPRAGDGAREHPCGRRSNSHLFHRELCGFRRDPSNRGRGAIVHQHHTFRAW